MERIHITTPEEAKPYEIRHSTQRWPRAGLKDVYTALCPVCKKRHRLTFYSWWLTKRPESAHNYWGMSHRDTQWTFDDAALRAT